MHTTNGETNRSRAICRLKSTTRRATAARPPNRPGRLAGFAFALILLRTALSAAAPPCEPYPIALSATTLDGRSPGDALPDVFNGGASGNFGWLTWAGSPSVPTLVDSLTPPGDSFRYVNPADPNDRELSVGDWVRGKPGVSNSKHVRDALDRLKSQDITVLVWDQTRGTGNHAEYRVSGFARVRLLDYRLPGQNRLTALYLGDVHCDGVNQPPAVDAGPDQSVQLTEPAALMGTAADDGLPAGISLTTQWTQVSGPGTAVFAEPFSAATSVSFDLPGNYELRLTAGDSEFTSSDTCVIAVNQPNRPPVSNPAPLTTAEDTAIDFELTAADPDDDPLTFRILVSPAHGVLTGNPPQLRYLPVADFAGPDRFTFEVSDGELTSGETEQRIEIAAVNDAPVADTQTLSTSEDVALTIQLSGSDVEGAALSYELLDMPAMGTLTGIPPSLIYTPVVNFFGSDSFRFRVSDGLLNSAEATVVILVGEINDPPVAFAQTLLLSEDFPLPLTLTGADVEGSTLAFAIVTPPVHGTLSGTPPDLTYVPALHYHGADAFTFRVDDGALLSEAATVVFEIASVNDAPVARASTVETAEDTTVAITLAGEDVDGDALTYEIVASPLHGTLTGTAPHLHYTPAPDFAGNDLIRFRVSDGTVNSEPAAVSITVQPVNDPPEAITQELFTNAGTSVTFALAGVDVEQAELSFAIVSDPAYGTLTGSPPNLTYAPGVGFHGTDSLTFRVHDGALDSNAATVTIHVLPANNPPAVAILAPVNGETFTAASGLTVRVQATDDEAIHRISLFANGGLLAELFPPSMAFAWFNPPAGHHILTATAEDNEGATATSGPVEIRIVNEEFGDYTVNAGPDQIVVWPATVSLAGTIEGIVGDGAARTVMWSASDGDPAVVIADRHALDTEVSFAGPGEYELRLAAYEEAGYRADTLRVVVLPPAPEQPRAARTSQGREFWFTLLNNHTITVEPNYLDALLVIQSDVDTDVTLTLHSPYFEQPAFEQRIRVEGGKATPVELPVDQTAPDLGISDAIVRNAIHLKSADPVSAWLIEYQDDSSEGTLLLPTALLGKEYRVMTYANSPSVNQPGEIVEGSQFAVVATVPDTLVSIVPATTIGTRTAGAAYEVTLQPGETYRLIDWNNVAGDLTGTRILASQPVTVFGGHTCANVPAGIAACNQLIEQLPPIDTWGRRFLTLPLHGRSGGDTFRVLASADHTVLRIGDELLTLDQGQFVERLLGHPAEILASRPVLVAQFANGGLFDSTTGDPSMTLVPPIEQFGGSRAFATPPPVWHNFTGDTRDVFTHFANIILPAVGLPSLRLDGAALSGEAFTPIGNSGFVGAQWPIATGQHQITASVPVGIWLYGWADFDAYGLLGGMFSDTVAPGVQFTLSQATSTARLGSTKTVVAQVTDELGRPVADHRVEFVVSGANSHEAQVTSNPLGLAVFEYTGTTAGEDVITARLAALERSVANTWIAVSPNQPPQVAAGDDRAVFLTDALSLDVGVTDDGLPAGPGLSLKWQTRNGPAAARFSDPNSAATTATFDVAGRYELALSAHDSEFETTRVFWVTVVNPVTLSLAGAQWNEAGFFWEPLQPGQAVPTGRTIRLTAELNGAPEGEAWSFAFFDGADPQLGGESGAIELTGLAPGSHSLSVRATGVHDLSVASPPLLLHVTAPPQIEVTSPLLDRIVNFDDPIHIQATATDPDGSIASLAVYFGPWLVAEVPGGVLDYTGLLPGFGTQGLRYVATDNLGLVTEQASVQVTITPPVVEVTLTTPVPGQNIRFGEPITFAANAAVGAPASISQVTFEWWGTLPWEWFPYWHFGVAATEPPFTATLDPGNFNYPAVTGTYQYRARAIATFDGAGASVPVTINVLPRIGVAIASPTNGSVLFTGNTYPIELSLEDPTGAFAQAAFVINGGPAIVQSGLRLDWTPTATGSHTISARVFDQAGQAYDATEAIIVQVMDPPLPVAQIVEPADGSALETGRLTFVFGEIQDPAAVVTNVTLLVNGVAMKSATTAAFTWKPEESGSYSLQLLVQDRLGRQATSPPITVSAAPEIYVGISHPQENELLALDQEIEVTANVSDPGNLMQRLELLVNNVKVDEADHIHLRWTPATTGPHTLQVVAWDWQGGSHPSVVIPVTVAQLSPPTIQLLTPANGSSWVANHPISLSVSTSDSDGAVTWVEIRSNGRAILTTNLASFAFPWMDAAPGWHELIATARDDTGQLARTDPIRIWVDYEVISGVPAPANLVTFSRRAGHARISWDPVPVPGLAGYVILRKTEPDGEWNRVGWAEPGRHYHEQSILSARTTYAYQVRAVVGTNHQSGPPAEGTVRTRSVMPEYGILDLTELVIGATADPSGLFSGTAKGLHASKPGDSSRTGPAPITSLDSISPVDRGPFRVLGISDAHELLLAHEDGKSTLWYPGGEADLTIPGFQPARITRSGVVVGSVMVEIEGTDGEPRPERRAARWDRVNGLIAVGGDPKFYREPATHAPLSQPYDAFHFLTDINAHGRAVGQASYVYFLNNIQNNDADPHFVANHATLWQGDASLNLGGVAFLNGFSRAAAINDAGVVVGWGAITETGPDGQPFSSRTHAARSDGHHWSESGGMVDLGTLGGSFSAALDVNNDGLTVGYSTLHPEDPLGLSQAALWLPASTLPVQLPNLGGIDVEYPDGYGYAAAINESNLVVGESVRRDGAMAATIWQRTGEPEEPGDPGTWEAEDLNVLADDDVWLLTNARDINSSGLIVGQGIKWIPNPQHPEQGQWEVRAFLLVPGALLTDANRDGVIDTRPGSASDDRNRVSRLDPWRFWVNDDKDAGDAGRTSKMDIPGSLTIAAPPLGGNVGSISGVRDLVDYFPLCLDIGRLLALFPATEFEYVIEQEDAAIRFAETSLSPADADDYLRDVAVATSLAAVTGQLRAPRSQFSPGATTDGRLSPAFLNHIGVHGAGVVLVEGRKPSSKPIRLDLRRAGQLAGRPVLRLFFGLSISPVEGMFRFKNLQPSGGGPSIPGDRLGEPPNYPDDLDSDKNFVFLHGYNVSANEARGWQAEFFKRLFWAGSRARFYGVSWYGYETKISDIVTPDYHVNVDNAFQTSGALAAFLAQVGATGETTVAAHSLGNMVVSAALQDWNPPVKNYFMLDAAVALEAYDASETRSRTSPNHNMVHREWDGPGGAYKETLRASEWYTLFPEDDHRRALTWRGRFDRVPVANVWNYYSSGEEVLQTHPQANRTAVVLTQGQGWLSGIFTSDEIDVELGRFVWALQEKNKGRGLNLLGLGDPVRLGSSDLGGWGFNDDDYFVLANENDRRRMTPAEANDINPLELRARPFFEKGRELALYTDNGSEYARVHRDRLLGEMIPARSLPAGANYMKRLDIDANQDMHSVYKNGWPISRRGDDSWRHSDITDVAYLFVWPLYESFVSSARLDGSD